MGNDRFFSTILIEERKNIVGIFARVQLDESTEIFLFSEPIHGINSSNSATLIIVCVFLSIFVVLFSVVSIVVRHFVAKKNRKREKFCSLWFFQFFKVRGKRLLWDSSWIVELKEVQGQFRFWRKGRRNFFFGSILFVSAVRCQQSKSLTSLNPSMTRQTSGTNLSTSTNQSNFAFGQQKFCPVGILSVEEKRRKKKTRQSFFLFRFQAFESCRYSKVSAQTFPIDAIDSRTSSACSIAQSQ